MDTLFLLFSERIHNSAPNAEKVKKIPHSNGQINDTELFGKTIIVRMLNEPRIPTNPKSLPPGALNGRCKSGNFFRRVKKEAETPRKAMTIHSDPTLTKATIAPGPISEAKNVAAPLNKTAL